ncbi:MAG: class I SAM-dependent methyltransferase [Gammaproteobacteria bacterium]|nr:class I SAM-dependent methyltransferase [Pseudomonadales bacterium]
MDFSAKSTTDLYSGREADRSWIDLCSTSLSPRGKDIADIGCGGGIYTFVFASLRAKSVVGVDKSGPYIRTANAILNKPTNVYFVVGDALSTGLDSNAYDLVFERALVHHLSKKEQILNVEEASRILRKDGILAVQDRTFEDVLDDDPRHWIRSILFRCFPELYEFERARRPSEGEYQKILDSSSLRSQSPIKFSELRKSYTCLSELKQEIRTRKGKSILFELTDDQLEFYCEELEKASVGKSLEEIDQWTLWLAKAH